MPEADADKVDNVDHVNKLDNLETDDHHQGYEEIIEHPEIADIISAHEVEIPPETEPIWFHAKFTDCMEMYADIDTVSAYFAQHREWFQRCSRPMKAFPLGENGYDLLIGRFGAFGYLVEARIGLDLIPPDEQGLYTIKTIPVPNYTPPGYEVDFQSVMELIPMPVTEFCDEKTIKKLKLPDTITGAKWHLDLAVGVKFPKFILAMSRNLIQRTGDNLLDKIVKQVSHRLTHKTQVDFHTHYHLNFPKHKHHKKTVSHH